MPHPRVAILVVLLSLTAGCFGLGSTVEPLKTDDPANNTTTTNPTKLPDRDQVCSGCVETNKTEKGVGGIEHKHDYWKGREQVVVHDRVVYMQVQPLFPDGEGSQAKSVAYVKLPNTSLVYEGTVKVEVKLSDVQAHPECNVINCRTVVPPAGAPDPAPPAFKIQYRSAADSEWRPPVALGPGAALSIDVKPSETDMPHSVSSLWVFRITSDRPTWDSFKLVVTAFKGRDVVDWPGHPDFYADNKTSRIVMQKHVTTHMTGIQEGILYDGGATWAVPDKLISHGTTKLEVIMNVTAVKSSTNSAATGFFLEYHNATIIGPEIQFGTRLSDADGTNDLKSYNFSVKAPNGGPIDPAGMDGPYQPQSRWGFRLMATFAQIESPAGSLPGVGKGVGLCPACYPYDIEYDVIVYAIHDPTAASDMMMG